MDEQQKQSDFAGRRFLSDPDISPIEVSDFASREKVMTAQACRKLIEFPAEEAVSQRLSFKSGDTNATTAHESRKSEIPSAEAIEEVHQILED